MSQTPHVAEVRATAHRAGKQGPARQLSCHTNHSLHDPSTPLLILQPLVVPEFVVAMLYRTTTQREG